MHFIFSRVIKPQCDYIVKLLKNLYTHKMSYSEHFRRKVLAKLEEGKSIRAVASQFEIDKKTK